jgi:hypothetical protein
MLRWVRHKVAGLPSCARAGLSPENISLFIRVGSIVCLNSVVGHSFPQNARGQACGEAGWSRKGSVARTQAPLISGLVVRAKI